MTVRQHDDRPSWKVSQAARVLIVGKDERRPSPQLQRWILRWMQRSPENLVNLFAVARIDRELGQLKLLDRSAELSALKPRPKGLALVTRRAAWAAGAVCVALLLLGTAISMLPDGGPPIRHVTLADGTVMHVLRGSNYHVELSDDVRLVNLRQGEAVFEVAKDPGRPFIVRSKLSDSIAVGTRFGVSADSAATTTTVSEGEVRVVAPASPTQSQARASQRTKNCESQRARNGQDLSWPSTRNEKFPGRRAGWRSMARPSAKRSGHSIASAMFASRSHSPSCPTCD